MNRRSFVKLLGSGLMVPVMAPLIELIPESKIVYILPPREGWRDLQKSTRIKTDFASLLIPGLKKIYWDSVRNELASENYPDVFKRIVR